MVEHNQSQYYGNQYKFNGKELDSTTGMYYYGARYYEPRFSIFVSVDPLAEQTMEPYSYVGNNPIMFTDPTGMSAEYPETIFPRLVKEDKNGNVIAKDGFFTKKFHQQMGKFMSTKIGKSYISNFMKKGDTFLGYTASENGKFSNYDFRISEMNIKEPSARGVYMRNQGSFSYGIDKENGNLYFNLKIDSNLSPDQILETIGHELNLHGYKVNQLINYYEKNGKDEFIRAMKNGEFPSGDDDHRAIRDWDCTHQGLNNYESFMNEIIGKDKNMKKTFDNERKHYKEIYNDR